MTWSSSKAPWLVWHGTLAEVTGVASWHSSVVSSSQEFKFPGDLIAEWENISFYNCFPFGGHSAFVAGCPLCQVNYIFVFTSWTFQKIWSQYWHEGYKQPSVSHRSFGNNLADGSQLHLTLGTNRQMADVLPFQADALWQGLSLWDIMFLNSFPECTSAIYEQRFCLCLSSAVTPCSVVCRALPVLWALCFTVLLSALKSICPGKWHVPHSTLQNRGCAEKSALRRAEKAFSSLTFWRCCQLCNCSAAHKTHGILFGRLGMLLERGERCLHFSVTVLVFIGRILSPNYRPCWTKMFLRSSGLFNL